MNKKILYTVFQMLSPSQRREGMSITVLLCISSLLDFFSLAFFLPIILLVLNPDYALKNEYLLSLYRITGFTDHTYFAMSITSAVILFVLLKTQITRWIVHQKARYAYHIANDLADRTLDQYFRFSYSQFTNGDYSKQSNRITNLPLTFANNIIIPAGTILSESIVALLLFTGILIFNSRAFIFLAVIVAPLLAIYSVKRKKLKHISEKIKSTYPLLLKYTMQSVEGWAEIKSLHKKDYFKKKFTSQHKALTTIFTEAHLTNTSPARVTELIAAWCIGSLIIYSLWSRQPYQQTLVLLSVYAGVSFRVIPSLNRIFAALLQIKTHEYVVQELSQCMPLPKEPPQKNTSVSFTEEIQLSGISFGHPHQPLLLNGISLRIQKGERVVITGKSGSGKTSLLLILLQFIKPSKGEIYIDKIPLNERAISSWQKWIGYIPQQPYILDGSIKENIAFGIAAHEIDEEKIKQAADQAEISGWIATLPEGINSLLGEKGAKISGGQRQRIAIARALYHDAVILLMDESTNQLDAETESEITHTLLQRLSPQKTIIMVSHKEKQWEHFDHVYELYEGRLEKRHHSVLI